MTLVQGGAAPYAPPAAVTDIIRRFRDRGLATPFTAEVLERAGIPESLSARTLQAFKLLDLVDADGNPSDAFQELARLPESEYRDRLKEVTAGAYSDVLQFADPATDDLERVRDAFRSYNPRGQQDRMVTLFLGLLEFAGMDVSAATASRKREPRESRPANPATKSPRKDRAVGQRDTPKPAPASAKDAALIAWFDTRPPISEPWATTDRDNFMATLRALIDGIYKEPSLSKEDDE